MRNSFTSSAAALGIALLAAGCGSTSPGGNGLTQTQQTALANAIVASNALSSTGAAIAPFIVSVVGNTGTLNASVAGVLSRSGGINASVTSVDASTFDAVGVQIVFTLNLGAGGSVSGAYSGVVGWVFNSAGNAVTELLTAGAIEEGSGITDAPTSGTYPITTDVPANQAVGTAAYWDGTNTFLGTDGQFVLSSASFGGSSTSCPSVSTGGQGTVTCSYTTGTMGGNFNFSGVNPQNPSSTYMQSNTTFSGLPAVQISFTLTQ